MTSLKFLEGLVAELEIGDVTRVEDIRKIVCTDSQAFENQPAEGAAGPSELA